MIRLRYFTSQAVAALRTHVPDRLDWYYDPHRRKFPARLPTEAWRESRIEAKPFAGRLENGRQHDAANALRVYEALRMLTPQQASDERFWAYLVHFECAKYVSNRWLEKRPDSADRATDIVRNHFFARDVRAVIRDNGVSRLWWLGRIANETNPEDPGLFLEIVLYRQDVRSALIERPGISTNRCVLRGIFQVMREHFEADKKLFKREVFRSWMVGLNRRGGVVLLDALPEGPLSAVLREEAERALEACLPDD